MTNKVFCVERILNEGESKAPIRLNGIDIIRWSIVNFAKRNIGQPLEMFDENDIKHLKGFYAARNGKNPASLAEAVGFAKEVFVEKNFIKSLDQKTVSSDDGDEVIGDFVADPSVEVDEQATTNVLMESVEKALPCLDSKKSSIVYKYYYEGFTQEEIGKLNGVTSNRIGQLQRKAISTLKTQLQKAPTPQSV